VSKKSADVLFQSGLEVCKLWVWTFLLCCVKPQSLPGSGDGSGELSRFCSVDVALNLALVQGIMQRSTGAPTQLQDPPEGVRASPFSPYITVRHINPKRRTLDLDALTPNFAKYAGDAASGA
jgi:hypothetical protein